MLDNPKGVAPFTGAWIEIALARLCGPLNRSSHPSRVRGLKYGVDKIPRERRVAPFTGAWIEIRGYQKKLGAAYPVAPFTGAWIEIP